ncbi:MAG TPA: PRC-barrel domain-containing protein [Candidatus Binatia bacterium]|jgi:sporulation protein YlmC with PRC-barrel domain|nr:PRC-barrel domain-containing protein [Candidatus Binatia bacterium]
MDKTLSFIALLSAGSLLFSGTTWAQQGTEGEDRPTSPPAMSEPSTSHQATDSDSFERSAEPGQRSSEATHESIPLATSKPAQQQALVSSSALVGSTVKDRQGEKLGELRELMIDPQNGHIVYAVVASGGVLGMGKKDVALPWETFKVGLEKDDLIVEIDKDKLQTAQPYEMSQR